MGEVVQAAKKYLIMSGGIVLAFLLIGTSMFAQSESSSASASSGYNGSGQSGIQIEGMNLYNSDGSVNQEKIEELEKILTEDYLNTVYHEKNSEKQGGPFHEYWGTNRHNTIAAFQCTWWADGRADQFRAVCLGKERDEWFNSTGNGGDVVTNAKAGGWTYGTEPAMNSLVSFADASYGHVAYVEAVDRITGEIYISHAGGGVSWFGIQKVSPNSDGTYSCSGKSTGFIYLD